MLPPATLDLETDPFEYGVKVKPFVSGYYDGLKFVYIWENVSRETSDVNWCIQKTVEMLAKEEPHTIYIHNGGRFDLFFFLPFLSKGSLRIINNRIVQCNMPSNDKGSPHVIRDSYAIMPFPLREFDKDEIDYNLMRPGVRNRHRKEILKYLKKDCTSLYELASAFQVEFGDKLTIGSAALTQLKKYHKFDKFSPAIDSYFRKHFYFGGRCQVFNSGIHEGPLKIIDVNNMYSFVMKAYLHPVGTATILGKKIEANTCFVVAEGENYGAFTQRNALGGLDFTIDKGTFFTSIHEWNAAMETGSFRCQKIIKTYGFDDRITFEEFVDHFFDARKLAKAAGDKIHALFYKYVLNSAYGKFAQNGANFFDWEIVPYGDIGAWTSRGWKASYTHENEYIILKRPTLQPRYNNVCTGASITGAARAVLLKGIHAVENPLYCDTDSLICTQIRTDSSGPVLRCDDTELGAWKVEAEGDLAAIAGKKLYAVWKDGKLVKKAHKGGRLDGDEIMRIARGETVEKENPVPAFKFDGSIQWIKRRFRKT